MKVLKGNMGLHCRAPTCRFRPRARCSAPRKCRPSAAIPASPICAPVTTRSTRRPRRSSRGSRPPTRCTTPGQARPSADEEEGRRRLQRLRLPRRPGAAPRAGQDASRDRPQGAADRPARAQHFRHGRGRVRALLQSLVDHTCQKPRIYHHDWKPGDAVVWDNRCLMHQATPGT